MSERKPKPVPADDPVWIELRARVSWIVYREHAMQHDGAEWSRTELFAWLRREFGRRPTRRKEKKHG